MIAQEERSKTELMSTRMRLRKLQNVQTEWHMCDGAIRRRGISTRPNNYVDTPLIHPSQQYYYRHPKLVRLAVTEACVLTCSHLNLESTQVLSQNFQRVDPLIDPPCRLGLIQCLVYICQAHVQRDVLQQQPWPRCAPCVITPANGPKHPH